MTGQSGSRQARPATIRPISRALTPCSPASCRWVTPPAANRRRIAATCAAVSFAFGCAAPRRGRAGRSWYVDETYVKVQGAWCSRYRAIDRQAVATPTRGPSARRSGTR